MSEIWKELGFKSEAEYREYEAENERMAKEKGFVNYAAYEKARDTEAAYKLDEGYDLYKDIETIAEYAKTHDPRKEPHKDYWYSYMDLDIKKLDELPRRLAIYLIRLLNTYRTRPRVDEFNDMVIGISIEKLARKGFLKITEEVVGELKGEEARKKYQKEREILEKSPIPQSLDIGDVYSMFKAFVDHIFMNWIKADFFIHEPELEMTGTVFENFSPEVDPNKIMKIEDLTQKDLVRLLRIVNSFRRNDIVDKFITDIGDIEDLYDLFYLFVGYIFQDYKNANYFLDEPELSTDPKYIPWQINMFGKPVAKEYIPL